MNTTTSAPAPAPSVSGRAAIAVIAGLAGIEALGPPASSRSSWSSAVDGRPGPGFTWSRPERATPPQQ